VVGAGAFRKSLGQLLIGRQGEKILRRFPRRLLIPAGTWRGETGPGESGSASFQPVLDESLPEVLTGTISFANLKQGLPVSGSFDLSTSHGRTFTGRFRATWGNEQLPYIR